MSTENTSVFEGLEARLKPNRNGALRKISERILILERLRPWMVGMGVFGAFLAALAKAFTGTSGIVLVWVGAVLAGVGGALVARFDFRKLELTTLLTEAEAIAEEAIEAGRKLQDQQSSAHLLDRRRLALIDANTVMREALEQALLIPEADPVGTVDVMIEMALRHLLVSIGLEQEEEWVISVFQVEGDELVRISAKRALRADEQKHSRRWKMNQGAVGAAWARQDVVVVSDGQAEISAHDIKVPAALQQPYDNTRYRSMAAVPVRLGDPVRIWGVVAVSSDRPGRFRRLPGDRQEQAVDTVRLIARMTALMAAAFERSH